MSSFADRLNTVFHTARGEGEPEQKNTEVIAAVQRESGVTISKQYMTMLRQGERTPSLKVAQALARHFGVPLDYLAGNDPEIIREIEAEMALVRLVRDDKVSIAARQVSKLSARGKEQAVNMINHILDLERTQKRDDQGRKTDS